MSGNTQREMLGSRLGFLLLSAGCAIGLGNVWRFPYITGAYGGAIFVGIYLLCLFAVVPTMIMEFAVGRAARRNMGLAFHILEPKGSKWHWGGKVALIGSYLLMMFYTTVTGWMLYYCWYMASGALSGLDAAGVGKFFGATLGDPVAQVVGMTLVVLMGCGVCAMGVQKGVERVVKLMMLGLLFILMALVIRSLTLPGAEAGVSFYLSPDPSKLEKTGLFPVINAAMNQAFFTLSVGIGAMCIFGSYQGKDRSRCRDRFPRRMAASGGRSCHARPGAGKPGPHPRIFGRPRDGIMSCSRKMPRAASPQQPDGCTPPAGGGADRKGQGAGQRPPALFPCTTTHADPAAGREVSCLSPERCWAAVWAFCCFRRAAPSGWGTSGASPISPVLTAARSSWASTCSACWPSCR